MHGVFSFPHFIVSHQEFAYIIIVLGIILEGDVIVLVSGALAHIGALSVPITLTVIILGGIAKLFLGYGIGQLLLNKFEHNRFFVIIKKRIDYFLPHFNQKPFWSIFIARFFTFGLHFFTIIFSSYSRIPFKKVAKADFSSLLIWAFGIFGIGYFFSFAATSITHDFRKIILIILICVVLFVVIQKIITSIVETFAELKEEKSK